MRNKFLAALLTLCMTSTMFTPAVFAQENEPIPNIAEEVVAEEASTLPEEEPVTEGAEEIYFSDDQEIHRVSREAAEELKRADATEAVNEDPQADGNVQEEVSAEQNAGETELIQLPTPTDLTWGKNTNSSTSVVQQQPGCMEWKIDKTIDENDFKIGIYREDETEPIVMYEHYGIGHHMGLCKFDTFYLGENFSSGEIFDSGRYYFTVQWNGDGKRYSDSETAKSEIWEYKRPEKQLETSITKMEWDWPNYKWEYENDISNVYGFERKIFFSKTKDEEPRSSGSVYSWGNEAFKTNAIIEDSHIQVHGKGYYYFKVRALSKDITKYRHGAWSELSPAYNLTEITESVSDSLNNILNSTSSNSSEIRQQVASINRTDLRSSMLADPAVLNSIQQLEQKITDNDGVDVEVNVADSNVAENFPADKVQIIGAKLNNPKADAAKITLQIDKPKKEDLVVPSRYKNSLAIKFSMDIDGIEKEEDQTLTVPVRITLPVPANINPKRLCILHYPLEDGTPALYDKNSTNIHTYEEDGQWYVSFMLDHFSDFVMTETASAVVTFDANGGVCGTQTLSVNEANTLPEIPVPTRSGYTFDGWYTAGGSKVDASTVFTEDATVTARWTQQSSRPNPIVTPSATTTVAPETPAPSETPSANETPTPSANETPTGTPEPTQTPQPKTEQTLKLRYEKALKREVGSVLTQTVTGAKTAVAFESSNPKAAKVDKTSGVITCVGVGKAVITAKAEESSQYKAAQKSVTIVVIPKTAKIKSLKSGKKGRVTIKSNLAAKGNDGYQIQYKHNGKIKKVSVKTKKALTKTIKGLKSGKTFKARIRAYKKADGKTYFGKYSPWKTVKKVR